MNRLLEKTYYDPKHPAGFGGAVKLKKFLNKKVKRDDIDKWLQKNDSYTLHKPVRKTYPRSHYDVSNIDDLWQADLIILQSLKAFNDNYTGLLTVVDALSKFAWVVPVKNKTNASMIDAFRYIFTSSNRKPENMQTDKGTEFVGEKFQNFLKNEGVHFYTTQNPDSKAALVERFNRTIMEKIFRYFTHNNTQRYIDVIQDLVDGYNASVHSTIRMKPRDVDLYNAALAYQNLKRNFRVADTLQKFNVGDTVRISKQKGTFEKGYKTNWTEEFFKVYRVVKHRRPIVYMLEDVEGEKILGTFYTEELQKITKDQDTLYAIEYIVQAKGKGRSRKVLVKWKGFPKKFNSWIPASSVEKWK